MSKLTEEDVIKENSTFVINICRLYCRGMEYSDCESAAFLGFLFAIRSYQKGVCDFKSYAKVCIRNHIFSAKKEYNRSTRCESRLSLDNRIEDSREPIRSLFFDKDNNFEELILFNDFVYHLDQKLKNLVLLYTHGHSDHEILELLHISRKHLDIMKNRLLKNLDTYYHPTMT